MNPVTAARERPATAPIETTGGERDDIRLLVASRDGVLHRRFRDLPTHLRPGDLVVVNTSATVPASAVGTLHASTGDRDVRVHLASPARYGAPDEWIVELRRPDQQGPVLDAEIGAEVTLRPGATARLLDPVPGQRPGEVRLWRAAVAAGSDVLAWLDRHGDPVRYGYLDRGYPRSHYTTVFGRHPGSAEMPSAGRPFTERTIVDLATRGVHLAPITLHTSLSSQETGEPPQPERYDVPAATARLVNHVRSTGGRVVAVGTTVTRALETASAPDGTVVAAGGWTDTVLGPDRPARVVDGLVTGWHETGASHLELLRAVVGDELVDAAYAEAHAADYAWHEFGDAALFLP